MLKKSCVVNFFKQRQKPKPDYTFIYFLNLLLLMLKVINIEELKFSYNQIKEQIINDGIFDNKLLEEIIFQL